MARTPTFVLMGDNPWRRGVNAGTVNAEGMNVGDLHCWLLAEEECNVEELLALPATGLERSSPVTRPLALGVRVDQSWAVASTPNTRDLAVQPKSSGACP